MTIELNAKERAILMWALATAKVDNQDYLERYPDSPITDGVREEIRQQNLLFDRLLALD